MNQPGYVKLVQAMYVRRIPKNANIEHLVTAEVISLLNTHIATFTEREIDILNSYYGLIAGKERETLVKIGERYGVTKERIRQIRSKSVRKLLYSSRTRYIWDSFKTTGFEKFG